LESAHLAADKSVEPLSQRVTGSPSRRRSRCVGRGGLETASSARILYTSDNKALELAHEEDSAVACLLFSLDCLKKIPNHKGPRRHVWLGSGRSALLLPCLPAYLQASLDVTVAVMRRRLPTDRLLTRPRRKNFLAADSVFCLRTLQNISFVAEQPSGTCVFEVSGPFCQDSDVTLQRSIKPETAFPSEARPTQTVIRKPKRKIESRTMPSVREPRAQ
jgi:hypothetical protein